MRVSGQKVGEALADLMRQHPELAAHLCDSDGRLRPFVNLFLGESHVRDLQGMETPMGPNEQLVLVPSIAGGSMPIDLHLATLATSA